MEKNKEIENWVIEYLDYLLQYAIFKTGDRQMAEDLVQETFISAYKVISSFKEESTPKIWQVSILRNKIIDFQRKENRKSNQLFSEGDSIFNQEFDEFNNWKNENRPFNDWNADANLMDDQDFQNMDANEICQELEISTSNYWQLIHRAKLKLRKCLDLKWFTK